MTNTNLKLSKTIGWLNLFVILIIYECFVEAIGYSTWTTKKIVLDWFWLLLLFKFGFHPCCLQSLLGLTLNWRYDCIILKCHIWTSSICYFGRLCCLFSSTYLLLVDLYEVNIWAYDGLREFPSLCAHYCLHCSFNWWICTPQLFPFLSLSLSLLIYIF